MEELVEEAAQVVSNLGVLSLLPIAVIFVVSIITKRSLLGMFCGVVTGCIIVAASTAAPFTGVFFEYLQGTLGNGDYQWLTTVVLLFGIMIALFEESGAITEFGRWASKFIKSKRQALVGTFLFGLIVFVDDYLSNLAVGATMRKITDKHKIPRTQLAYIVLIMAGPISQLIPISSWTAAYVTIFEEQGVLYNGSAMTAFLRSIPFIFYAWVVLIVCLLQILGVLPKLGMIKRDSKRAEEKGELFPLGGAAISDSDIEREIQKTQEEEAAKGGKKAYPFNFLIPILVTVVVTLLNEVDILMGAFWGTICALILYIVERKLTFYKSMDACFHGVLNMGYCLILFVLAFTVNAINEVTGMPGFVIACVEPILSGSLLPLTVFVVCAAYGYFTGACWDLAMIIMPIVVPLALAIGIDPIIAGRRFFRVPSLAMCSAPTAMV
ncbi:Na+/H+ antiporter NhaC family protein [Treponema primitia]|uniref:Na+/H+ antiporter NhaC family protein n=1 Tax=Treponema primitia TaxID=88058 RepID=UPI0002554C9D|nr:Na+/H+ antiporter NhaC family protein [Treponema primitia]